MQVCFRQNLRWQLCFARLRLKLPAAHDLLQSQCCLRPILQKPVIVCRADAVLGGPRAGLGVELTSFGLVSEETLMPEA